MRKLSPSISIKTVIHAPGFYDFAQQNLFHARSRATAEISDKRALSTDCSHAAGMTVAHTPCALFPPNLAFGKEGGQACRSRPRKIPHKSQGVYLTFIPLPAPRRRGLVRCADERGVSFPVSPEPETYPGGTASPLEAPQRHSLSSMRSFSILNFSSRSRTERCFFSSPLMSTTTRPESIMMRRLPY